VRLLDTLRDDALLAGSFPGPTWDAWRVFLRVLDGLPLAGAAAELYRRSTGRTDPPTSPAREVVCIVGRRGGKSRMAAALAVEAAVLRDWRPYLARGETATIAIIAADRAQAAIVASYVRGLLTASPLLRQRLVREREGALDLTGHVTIEVATCSARTTRGYSFALVIADEVAFWRSETSSEPDVEVLAAVRPGLATLPGARIVCISSPYARRGALWRAYREHYAKDGDPVLVWKAPSLVMNPSLDPTIVAQAYESDPAAASAEFGGEFRTDVEGFLSREVLDGCIVPGRMSLPPLPRTGYVGFVDPSGGSQGSFCLAIAHGEVEGDRVVAVLDDVQEVRPPFSPEAVVREFAATVRRYGCGHVVGDRYGGEFPRELFAKAGITYVPSEKPKSDIYRELLPMLTSGRVRLLDHARLLMQFIGLERRTARGGRDSIDHAPQSHDDLANAAAGALVQAATAATGDFEVLAGNVAEVPRGRLIDVREFELLRRVL
jgi:hypothetical protein